MTLSHRYADFGTTDPPKPAQAGSRDQEEIEDEKLQSFENGYKSGWDDALKAQSDTFGQITEDFAQNLQQVSFSFAEARGALIKELQTVFEPLLDRMLPQIARETLAAHVLDVLKQVTRDTLEGSLEIVVSPQRMVAMQHILSEANLTEPYRVVPDETLEADVVFLRIGREEKQLDFEPWLDQVQNLIRSHFDILARDIPNG